MAINTLRVARLLGGTAGALLALGWSGTAFAQDATNASTTQLETIVVEGKVAKGDRVAPTTTTTERAEIQQRMVEDFQDLGRRVDAGVNFNSRTNSINLRGLDGNRVLTTIDGIRVPWLVDPRESAQGGLNSFDFDGLSSIDITRGADSSRYGSGALGGVVQLQTLNPEDLLADGKTFGTLVKGVYDSTDESWRANAAVAGRVNDTWMLVQGGYKAGNEIDNQGTIGGYGTTRTEANPRDFDQGNLLVKLHQYVDGGHRFGLTGELYNRKDDIDNMRGTSSSYEKGTLDSGEEVSRQRISGTYDYVAPDKSGWLDEAHVVGYWQRQKLNNTTDATRLFDGRGYMPAIPAIPFIGFPGTASGADLYYGAPYGAYKRDNELKQDTYGFSGNGEKQVDLGSTSHTFRFGGDIYGQKLHQYSWGEDNCPDVDWSTIPQYIVPSRGPDGNFISVGPQSCRMLHTNSSDMPDVDSVVIGLFAEDDIDLMNGQFTLTPGVRFDWYEHKPKSTADYEKSPNFSEAFLESTSDSRFSPKLRGTWHASNELDVFAQWSQGFRAPSALELYQNYGSPGSYARIGNPDLKSETSNGFEVGAKYQADTYALSATVFNNYYRNFISQVQISPPDENYPVGGVSGYRNLDRVQIYGVEVGGEWNFANNWRTWGSLAWAEGKNTDTDEYLNSVAPLRAIVGLGYATETWGSDVSITMASARDKVSGTGFVAPGYGIVDATVWWEPEQVKGLKLQAGVFNIFDQKYWDAISVPDGTSSAARDYYSEAGRTFRLAISHKF